LEITRFTGARRPAMTDSVVRAAIAATAGGMKRVASVSRSAGSALWRSLATSSVSWVRSSRRAGSGSSVAIGTTITDTRLPNVPYCSSVRTETGTIAMSGSAGSASRSASHRRTMPVHSATTTSLTVKPKASLICLTVSSGSLPKAKRRWGEIGPLNGVGGAGWEANSSTSRSGTPGIRRWAMWLSVLKPGTSRVPGSASR